MSQRPKDAKKRRSASAIQAWLVSHLAERLEVAPGEIDVREPFARYGLDSVMAAGLTGELADWIGGNFPDTLFQDYPTIESLASYVSGESSRSGMNPSSQPRRRAKRP